MIKKWTPKEVSNIEIALSCPREENFRRDLWPGYKESRDVMYTPEYLEDAKEYLQDTYKCKRHPRIEADDLMGVYASSNRMIAVTIDKDLRGVAGWHFNPDKEDSPVYVNKDDAYRFFCKQWLTGDSVDGIPGLWKIGPKKADRLLDEWDFEDWEQNIIEMYASDKHKVRDDRGIPHPDIAIVMARCVKIFDSSNYNLKTKTIIHWEPKGGS